MCVCVCVCVGGWVGGWVGGCAQHMLGISVCFISLNKITSVICINGCF